MRKIFMTLLVFSFMVTPASAFYTIDGYLDDWGINLNLANSKTYLNTHLPSGGHDIDYVTEDNTDKNSGWKYVGPGWSQGNTYDAEAIYFDNDEHYAYLAVVAGTPKTNVQWLPGDIFLDVVDPVNGHYSYGVDILEGKLYEVKAWESVVYPQHAVSHPWRIGKGASNALGDVDFVYSNNQNSHYVLEARLPLSLLDVSAGSGDENQDIYAQWTMECGNDYLKLHGDINVVPEPATFLLLFPGILGALGFRKKN